jgi:hypothetical protein
MKKVLILSMFVTLFVSTLGQAQYSRDEKVRVFRLTFGDQFGFPSDVIRDVYKIGLIDLLDKFETSYSNPVRRIFSYTSNGYQNVYWRVIRSSTKPGQGWFDLEVRAKEVEYIDRLFQRLKEGQYTKGHLISLELVGVDNPPCVRLLRSDRHES